MRLNLTAVYVDDQDKALRFYTEVLGFVKKTEIPVGEFRWLTVVSAEQETPELLLEPSSLPAVAPFKPALVADGIPLYVIRRRRCGAGIQALTRPRRHLHAGAGDSRARDDRRLRRHLRQSDPALRAGR